MNARIQKLGLLLGSLLIAACAGGKDGTDGAPGTPGPEGEGGPRPRIDSVSPPVGSLRNVVFLTGTSFSAVPSENEVRFGGETASVIDATATTLSVLPPFELDPGYAPITVTRGENISAPVGFTLVLSGTELPSRFAAPELPGEPVELADGRVLVPDASGSILVIENDGIVRELARGQGLTAPSRLVTRADGKVIVFDPAANAVFRVDADTGVVEVEHWGTPYAGGSHDAAGNLFAFQFPSGSVDRIAPDGTVTPAWCTAPTSLVTDVQVIGTDVYLSLVTLGPGSVVKCSTAAAGAPTLVTATGIGIIHSLAPAGADLVAGGIFTATNDQEGVVRIAANGAITAVTTDPAGQGRYGVVNGAILLQGGEYLIVDGVDGFVGELAGTALTVRAGAVAGDGASLRVGQKTFAAATRGGAFAPGWLVELDDAGTSRVAAQGRFAQLIAGADDTTVVAVRPDVEDVASIAIATGVVTSLFSVATELAAPSGVTRDATGNWYVSSTTDGKIAQYTAAGVVSSATFAAVPGVGTLHAQPTSFLAISPAGNRVDRVSFSGGTVSPWLAPGAGVDPAFAFRDLDESVTRDLVADRAGNRVVDVDSYGFVAEFATGLPAASSIAQRADGMLLVRCADGVHLLTP